ncbi:MAG TPA: hypothetical protein IGS17_00560 [Oscillatoriales cyanobacterium M59_W2019_021]|nr:MAG: hypothetical protein D6728_07520 [Cyanobacteria bacterium J055]HIK29892.1 hypothetical protein [Oscillatoriales cyanobacterium M4454_W2019_049]HIK49408.1 hypothetical protein [Oscillatoriales cyanobacterium M59_W2019_021]
MSFWKTDQYPLNAIARSLLSTGEPVWSDLNALSKNADGEWGRSLTLAQLDKRRSILPRVVEETLQSLHWANRAQNSKKYAEVGAFLGWLGNLSRVFTIQNWKYATLTDRLNSLDRRYPTEGNFNDRLLSLSRQILSLTYVPGGAIEPSAAIVTSVVLKLFALPGANWGRANAARYFKQGLDVTPSFRPSPGYPVPPIPDVTIPPRPVKLPSGNPAAPIGAWKLIFFVGAIALAAYLVTNLLLEKPVGFQEVYLFGEEGSSQSPDLYFAVVHDEPDSKLYLVRAAGELVKETGKQYDALTGFVTDRDKKIQEAYNLLNLGPIPLSEAGSQFDRLMSFFPEDAPPF